MTDLQKEEDQIDGQRAIELANAAFNTLLEEKEPAVVSTAIAMLISEWLREYHPHEKWEYMAHFMATSALKMANEVEDNLH